MAILFDWYENPGAASEAEATLHPRIFMNGKVDTKDLCKQIHLRSSLTVGDVKSALDTLAQLFGESLREGKAVHLEGIGYFYPTLGVDGKVTRTTPHKTGKVVFKGIRFRSDCNLKGMLAEAHVNRANYTRHSAKLSEVEIDIRLKEYFAEHRMMNRRDFQDVCTMTSATARVHLARLRKEGKLVNVGLPMQPIYVPAPGYYGVSREAERPTR